MLDLRNPKAMAKALRVALARRDIDASHSECLEIVAQQLGWPDWNTCAAKSSENEIAPLIKLVLPNGWQVAGTQAQDYHIGVDPDVPGSPAMIKSIGNGQSVAAFATLMQSVTAEQYRGSRLQLSAELQCVDTSGHVTIWMRVDDVGGRTLRFDNMERRGDTGPLTGFTDWSRRTIVLDVPESAESVHYGFFLKGQGQVSARSFDLVKVGDDVDTTSDQGVWLEKPMNLDFVERSLREVSK